jgi:polyferredoxin
MLRQLPKRQRIRKALIILAFLSFPVTMNLLSPVVILNAAANGIVNGSLIMFGLMFLTSLFLGRAWCGWVCPGGGMQEIVEPVNNRPVRGEKIDWIKWLIWVPWVGMIAWLAVRAGGYSSVVPFFMMESGVSVDEPFKYIIYYGVVLIFLILAVAVGRRAGCHTICWMAPFMMIGRWVRNRLNLPALRLQADASACSDCKTCTRGCPMSLDVNAMVQKEQMEHSECILCGTCIDHCSKKAIRYSFSRGK